MASQCLHPSVSVWSRDLLLYPARESCHPGVDPRHSGQSTLVTGGNDPDLHPVARVLLLVEETATAVTLAGVSAPLLQASTHEAVVNLNSGEQKV